MSSRSDEERIQDILSAINRIQARTAGMSFDELPSQLFKITSLP